MKIKYFKRALSYLYFTIKAKTAMYTKPKLVQKQNGSSFRCVLQALRKHLLAYNFRTAGHMKNHVACYKDIGTVERYSKCTWMVQPLCNTD